MPTLSLEEGEFSDDATKTVYFFYDAQGNPVHKALEVFKTEPKIVMYPYTVRRVNSQVTSKKIKEIEFIGWTSLSDLPKDFKITSGYGPKTKRIKSLLQLIYPKFRQLNKIVIASNGRTRFSTKTISFNWGQLEPILKAISREQYQFDKQRKAVTINALSELTNKFTKISRSLTSGELEEYLQKFDSFDRISTKDAESLAQIFQKLPASRIVTSSHFIQTKEKLEIIYLENVIERFKVLLDVKGDNEEDWQQFFTKYSWILTHLFPFQVILRKDKAYVGGKTIENKDGRIVDFLFQNDLSENFALLEVKTHNKELLKNTPYRKPDVYASSDELSGGLNQCLDQKDSFLREMGEKNPSYDPKSILVIGLKSKLNKHQKKCFELLRANQKNVDIVTFDELLAKLEGLHSVITGKFE